MKTKKIAVARIVLIAMFAAMYVVLGLVSIKLPNMKITVDGLPIIAGAMILGPLDGMLIGAIGSLIDQMLGYGLGVTTILWMIPVMARGLLVGWYAKSKNYDLNYMNATFIILITSLVVTTLNTGAMWLDSVILDYYSKEYVFGNIIWRYAASVLTAIAYSVVLPPVIKLLQRTKFLQYFKK